MVCCAPDRWVTGAYASETFTAQASRARGQLFTIIL
jgi:hypothetical protein